MKTAFVNSPTKLTVSACFRMTSHEFIAHDIYDAKSRVFTYEIFVYFCQILRFFNFNDLNLII